jgi:hypothetical protein
MIKAILVALSAAVVFSAAAAACPIGTHPVCEYIGGRSVCSCVR